MFRRWPFSTQVFIVKCRYRRQSILALMSGSRAAFADTDSTASIISIAPNGSLSCWSKDEETLKVVTCHLGNGCSVAAIQGGRSIDTTMGFTPLDGLMMGTRSGSVDPGILTYLMRQGQLDAQEIDNVLNQKSGLLGISGLSGDMRDILAALQQGHKRAKLAFDIYVHRLRAAIGGMAAVLGGMDVLVFTAGVGENSPEVRAAACRGLEFLGLRL